jgi:hypothetical protein
LADVPLVYFEVTHFSARISIRLTLLQLAIAATALWFVFGNPLSAVADLFYSSAPAPWEEIDLIYYPDKLSPSVNKITADISSLEECRTWARHQADQHNDPRMERGRYECRTVSARLFGSQRNYRLSLQ